MVGLEFLELTQQGVKLGIGDFWVVEDVVPLFVMANAVPELLELLAEPHWL